MLQISEQYWENVFAVIMASGIVMVFVERSLYQIFHTKLWNGLENFVDKFPMGDFMDLKPWISLGVCLWFVFLSGFDVLGMILRLEKPIPPTLFLSSAFIAGGSTGFYKMLKQMRAISKAKAEQEINGD